MVIEISRHGDDGSVDGLSQILFGDILQLHQDKGRNLGRRIKLAERVSNPGITIGTLLDRIRDLTESENSSDFTNFRTNLGLVLSDFILVKSASNKSLDTEESVSMVDYHLTLSRLAYQSVSILHGLRTIKAKMQPYLVNGKDRRSRPFAIIFDYNRLISLNNGYTRVGRAKIDTNDLAV